MNEQDYERGSRMAWSLMLQQCLLHLGYKSEEGGKVAWIAEREAAIRALRDVCEHHGDNDWPEELHLADIIEKHLGRHLEG
jgi:hypothetical protein